MKKQKRDAKIAADAVSAKKAALKQTKVRRAIAFKNAKKYTAEYAKVNNQYNILQSAFNEQKLSYYMRTLTDECEFNEVNRAFYTST